VLTEADDPNDPVAESARAILDGHIVLSRKLAESAHFPAIDIEASISRAMNQVTTPEHQRMARAFRQFYSLYEQNRDLLSVGAYKTGTNALLDQAIATHPKLIDFLRQELLEKLPMAESLRQLKMLMETNHG
jgi:flagellum-specific ATP synthase